jgi:hypothetical protein
MLVCRSDQTVKSMATARLVDVKGVRTRYYDYGQGDAILLLHGGRLLGRRIDVVPSDRLESRAAALRDVTRRRSHQPIPESVADTQSKTIGVV